MTSNSAALTARQTAILAFIAEQIKTQGRPPTRAEIAEHFGFRVTASAQEHLQSLAKKGYIALEASLSRGLKLLKNIDGTEVLPHSSSILLPLIGDVRAGQPMVASAHVEQEIALQTNLFSPRADFLLRVRGDSMNGAGILEGDYLGVSKNNAARSGQIVVARVGDEVTVKTLQISANKVMLLPSNSNYQPLVLALDDPSFAIEGIVVGVIRRLKL